MAEAHDVYPNAPLALVAVEVRFPVGGAPALPTTLQRSFRDLLGPGWVIETLTTQRVSVSIGPGGSAQLPPQIVAVPRFTVRDRTLAIAVTEDSLTVETTRYRNYPEFRAVLEKALTATRDVLNPDGVARVGLRYIDEIRVPGIPESEPTAWRDWVEPSLLPPHTVEMATGGFNASGWEGAAQYDTGPERKLVLRYGPRVGYAVNPVGPLKRPRAPLPGPLFALDFDSFWEPADIPEYDPETLITACDELRRPIRTLFDLLVTDKLLTEFKKDATR